MLDVSNPLNLQACTFSRVDEIRLPLVNKFYASCDYHVKCGRLERVYSLSRNAKIIAAARLIPYGGSVAQIPGSFLLRNLCVAPDVRNQGVASYLLRAMLQTLNPITCYCYALPHLQDFYIALGFKHLSITEVPQDIGDMYIRHCARKRGWILMGFVH